MPAGLAKQMVDKYFTKHQNAKAELSLVLKDKIKEDKLQKLATWECRHENNQTRKLRDWQFFGLCE